MLCAIILAAFVLLPAVGRPATWYVPDHFPSIQDAIDAASSGDEIIVRPGTYMENIDFLGKAITLRSDQGAAVTAIDGGHSGSTVVFQSGEGAGSVLDGFTVTNGLGGGGYPNYRGGGINCTNSSSPTITNNILAGNSSPTAGGGIACTDYSDAVITNNTITGNSSDDGGGIYGSECFMTIVNNTITGNSAAGFGGGIYGYYAGAIVRNNVIKDNSASYKGGGMAVLEATHTPYPIWEICNNTIADNSAVNAGGGISIQCSFPPPGHNITNNTITGNTAGLGGAMALYLSAYPVVTNSILWGNSAPEIYVDSGGGNPTVSFSDIDGGWPGAGNIDEDPLFAESANDDFHLTWNSACRDAGDNSVVTEPCDFEGDPRIAGGVVDMGADELHTHLYHLGDVLPGGSISIRTVGTPAMPVKLVLGSGIQDPPQSTQYGDLHLLPPYSRFSIGSIPSNGILFVSGTVPASWQTGEQYPFQALVGPLGNPASELTNLMPLVVQ